MAGTAAASLAVPFLVPVPTKSMPWFKETEGLASQFYVAR